MDRLHLCHFFTTHVAVIFLLNWSPTFHFCEMIEQHLLQYALNLGKHVIDENLFRSFHLHLSGYPVSSILFWFNGREIVLFGSCYEPSSSGNCKSLDVLSSLSVAAFKKQLFEWTLINKNDAVVIGSNFLQFFSG